jgi:sodium-coupled neutral amino acid transporter 9
MNEISSTKEEEKSMIEMGDIRHLTIEKLENFIKKDPELENKKKNSSFQTVFSIWNTMIGSAVVSIPYNVYYAGIIPTIFIGLLYGLVLYLTCAVIVRLGGKEDDFSVIVYNYLVYAFGEKTAKVGKIIQIIFTLMMNGGATLIYFLIINQNLYPCLCLFLKVFDYDIDSSDLSPHFDKFSLFYCSLIVTAIEFPLTIFKKLNCLSKFNSYGIYFISVLLIFVIYTGIRTMAIDSFRFEYKENVDGSKVRNLYLFGENPGLLTGSLSMGLFCHSVILPLIKNNKIQENNQRDLFLGYLCITLTYIIIGIFGYIGFSGSEYSSKFQGNWFLFFKSDN